MDPWIIIIIYYYYLLFIIYYLLLLWLLLLLLLFIMFLLLLFIIICYLLLFLHAGGDGVERGRINFPISGYSIKPIARKLDFGELIFQSWGIL